MNLLLPVAGGSTRFPNMKPKWLLNNPNENLMIVEAIKGLNLKEFKKIYIIALEEHLVEFKFEIGIKNEFKKLHCADKLEFVILKQRTVSQPQTIARAILQANIEGQIYIKDSDNYFKESRHSGNFISTYDLNNIDLVHAKNKSYVVTNDQGMILNIVEKRIISSTFNVGGYGFESAKKFLKYYNKLKHNENLYISHVIYQMILDGIKFQKSTVKEYIDWGTFKEWALYRSQFSSIFVNIDGVIFKNSSEFFEPFFGETKAISSNVEALNKLYYSGKTNIILTTSRKESFREMTIEQLNQNGVKYHQILFNLNAGKNLIINDYNSSKPYKSCDSINIKSDSDDLKDMLEDTLGFTI